jgi:hypothetical protein
MHSLEKIGAKTMRGSACANSDNTAKKHSRSHVINLITVAINSRNYTKGWRLDLTADKLGDLNINLRMKSWTTGLSLNYAQSNY